MDQTQLAAKVSSMLEAKGLYFSYKKGIRLIEDLSFTVSSGEILAICGANGSGKSTVLDLLAGLIEPISGEISLDGEVGQGYLLQNAAQLPLQGERYILGATVREELELGLKTRKNEKGLIELAQSWELAKLLDNPTENLSWGEKKRLAIASLLAGSPKVFLMDEPFNGLDYPGTKSLIKDLSRIKKEGLKLVVVTHEPALLKDICDMYLLLRPGEYLFTRDKKDLAALEDFGVRPF
ncbi:MAG: energy-coupling factor ABC transporter ATP-binding protein [Deltaproteobacteria bacterium]|jgi:biotin transport system ATP-binding protein|nr:energy-coupling factor ABC transporter ATP-binding protein [Deltaproteobacteria bacterium]